MLNRIIYILKSFILIWKYNYPFSKIVKQINLRSPKNILKGDPNFNGIDKCKILILSPHPDDEILGMGGLIQLYVNLGSKIKIVYLTNGINALQNDITSELKLDEIRKKESIEVCKLLNIQPTFWDIPDAKRLSNNKIINYLKPNEKCVGDLTDLIHGIRPNKIFLTSFYEYSPDHYMANKILYASLSKIKLTNFNIFGYEVWNLIPFPNFFIDITSVMSRKLELLNYYKSQTDDGFLEKLILNKNKKRYQMGSVYRATGFSEAFIEYDPNAFRMEFNRFNIRLNKMHLTNNIFEGYVK